MLKKKNRSIARAKLPYIYQLAREYISVLRRVVSKTTTDKCLEMDV